MLIKQGIMCNGAEMIVKCSRLNCSGVDMCRPTMYRCPVPGAW